MARAFTDGERERARQALLDEGRRLFAAGGLAALSLSRLAAAAGIAKTSFYAFFPSKEALVLDLLAAEAPGVDGRVLTPIRDPAVPAPEALSRLLRALLREYAENPVLARLVAEPGTLSAIARRVRPEDLERKAAWMERPLAAFLEARMAAGEIAPRPLGTLLDLVRSVSLLALHRDRFGTEARFEAAASALIDLVAEGLARTETPT